MKALRELLSSLSIILYWRKLNKRRESATPADLVDMVLDCPAIRPLQRRSEFLELVTLLREQNCKYLLEIGTYKGGALFVFSQLAASDATVISLDFPGTFFGKLHRASQALLFRKLIRKGQSFYSLRSDSHRPETLAIIRNILQGNKLDFLFIDGDHSYDGVREDFKMYAPLVRDGGLIAFHDISPCEASAREPRKEVYRFWEEVKRNHTHREFIEPIAVNSMGIGVLWI
jgi:predicted O-methyltransferase YrrM